MKTLLFQGLLANHSYGEADDILFLSGLRDPLAEELRNAIERKQVTARYWITDRQVSKDEADEAWVGELMGLADCEFYSHYSETTGYLWTDENARIGGHDLIGELKSYAGRWLILEIDVHDGS